MKLHKYALLAILLTACGHREPVQEPEDHITWPPPHYTYEPRSEADAKGYMVTYYTPKFDSCLLCQPEPMRPDSTLDIRIGISMDDLTGVMIRRGAIEFFYKAFSYSRSFETRFRADSTWKDVYKVRGDTIAFERRVKGKIIPSKTTPESVEWPE